MSSSITTRVKPTMKKVMTLFYLIDTSGSMAGEKLGKVNAAMQTTIYNDLQDLSANNSDAVIKVAILDFSTGVTWVTKNGPEDLQGFEWEDLKAKGLTSMGAAFRELNRQLSKDGFMRSKSGAYAPVVLLITDGQATDDWKVPLEELKTNDWFKHAIKIALALGEGPSLQALQQFTGSEEAVIRIDDWKLLFHLIKTVSVRASEFQSQSRPASAQSGNEGGKILTSANEEARQLLQEGNELFDRSGSTWVSTPEQAEKMPSQSQWVFPT